MQTHTHTHWGHSSVHRAFVFSCWNVLYIHICMNVSSSSETVLIPEGKLFLPSEVSTHTEHHVGRYLNPLQCGWKAKRCIFRVSALIFLLYIHTVFLYDLPSDNQPLSSCFSRCLLPVGFAGVVCRCCCPQLHLTASFTKPEVPEMNPQRNLPLFYCHAEHNTALWRHRPAKYSLLIRAHKHAAIKRKPAVNILHCVPRLPMGFSSFSVNVSRGGWIDWLCGNRDTPQPSVQGRFHPWHHKHTSDIVSVPPSSQCCLSWRRSNEPMKRRLPGFRSQQLSSSLFYRSRPGWKQEVEWCHGFSLFTICKLTTI